MSSREVQDNGRQPIPAPITQANNVYGGVPNEAMRLSNCPTPAALDHLETTQQGSKKR
jgi:hypothetical protein